MLLANVWNCLNCWQKIPSEKFWMYLPNDLFVWRDSRDALSTKWWTPTEREAISANGVLLMNNNLNFESCRHNYSFKISFKINKTKKGWHLKVLLMKRGECINAFFALRDVTRTKTIRKVKTGDVRPWLSFCLFQAISKALLYPP